MLNKSVLFLVVTIFSTTYAKARNDRTRNDDSNYWNDFGDNLGRDINRQVQDSLKGLDNLGSDISRQVQSNLGGLDNLGSDISRQVQSNLGGLDNLGATIEQQVYQGLKPVREMETRFRIIFGNDGTTIATFKDKRFIVRAGVMYECDGTISDGDGSCSGTLNKARFSDKKDFCYANANTIINDWYCISNGNVNSGVINNQVYCNSNDNSPTLLIRVQEYRDLCGTDSKTVTYKYFTKKPIGDHSSDVKCSGTAPIICTLTETRNNNVNNVNTGN